MASAQSTASTHSRGTDELIHTNRHALIQVEASSLDEEKATVPFPPEFVRRITGFKWVLVCAGFYTSNFLYGLDNTIAADIQSAILETFGDISELSWIGTGFPLGSIVTILTFGKAYGIFNVKYLHIGCVTTFAIGSAICGAAPSMSALIIGRVIAGIGGAGMYLGNLNLLTLNTTLRECSVYMGGVGIVWGAGTILGPVIGGLFADSKATWRWAFYINLIFYVLMLPSLLMIPGFQPLPEVEILTKVRRLDWVGAVLNAGLYTSFVIALTFAGTNWSWNDGRTIASFVASFAILIGFGLQQCYCIFTTSAYRLFPIAFLRSRTMVMLFITTSCAGAALLVPIFYIPLYFQFTRGDNGLQAAVRLLPFVCVCITFIMGQGILLPKVAYYYPFFIASEVFTTLGGVLLYTVDSTTSNSAIYGFTVLLAIGAALASQAAYSIVPAKVEPQQISDAIGFINVAQNGGITLSLAISGAVFQNTAYTNLREVLGSLGFSDKDIRSAVAGSQSAIYGRMGEALRREAIEAIVQSIDSTYCLVIAVGAVGLVASIFLKREKLVMEISTGGA